MCILLGAFRHAGLIDVRAKALIKRKVIDTEEHPARDAALHLFDQAELLELPAGSFLLAARHACFFFPFGLGLVEPAIRIFGALRPIDCLGEHQRTGNTDAKGNKWALESNRAIQETVDHRDHIQARRCPRLDICR